MSVQGSVSLGIDFTNVTTADLEEATIRVARSVVTAFVDGSGAGAVNKMWQDTRPLTDAGNEALDFSPTPTSGASGIVTFAALKVLLVYSPTTNTTNITLSRVATTGLGIFAADADALAPLKPGGLFLFTDPSAAGLVVTASDTDVLTLTNSAGAAATYFVFAAGI